MTREQVASGYFVRLKRKPYARKSRADPSKARIKQPTERKCKVSRPPKLTDVELMASILWGNVRKRSVRTCREFDLTLSYVREMVQEFCNSNYYSLNGKDPFKPSIDRIDHLKGYTKENTRIVWMMENYARSTFTDEQVIEFCKRKLNLI